MKRLRQFFQVAPFLGLLFLLAGGLWISAQTTVYPVRWGAFEPRVIRAGQSDPVALTAVVSGTPSRFEIVLNSGGIVPLSQASPGVYTATLTAAQALSGYQTGDAHNFLGFLDLYQGTTRVFRGNVVVNVRDATAPDVTVRGLSPDAQMSRHLINFRDDSLYFVDRGSVPPEVFRRLYQYRGDDFDFIGVIGQVGAVRNRFFLGVRNTIRGLGISIFDSGAAYGSAGRLAGIIQFPGDAGFDWADTDALHEIGHRWCCYLNLPLLLPGRPHWPIGDITYGIMGWSNPFLEREGLQFPWCLTMLPDGNYLAEQVGRSLEFNDLELYLMGLMSPGEVGRHFVFRDQTQTLPMGGLFRGPVDFFTVDDIIRRDGSRVPPASTGMASFRVATIVLSRGRLLNSNEMAFFDYMAARGEADRPLPLRSGGAPRGMTEPFVLATKGRALLSTTLCPECVVAAAAELAIISGNNQSGEAGATLAAPLVVEARDQFGNKFPGATVAFTATNASVNPASAVADASGRASTMVTLGSTVGPASITARVGSLTPVTFTATATTPRPRVTSAGVVNAASFAGGPVAPGEVVTFFGAGIGPPSLAPLQLTAAGGLDVSLAGTRIFFDDVAAPLVYAQAKQSSAVVPYAVAGKTTTQVVIEYQGVRSNAIPLVVTEAAPALFTADASGRGQGAILNEDTSLNSAANPAGRGSIVVLYATGEGQTEPPGVDGKLAQDPLPKPRLPVGVRIGGLPCEILYAGAAPGLVAGVLQINARVPSEVTPNGGVPVSVTVGSVTSPLGVTLAIR